MPGHKFTGNNVALIGRALEIGRDWYAKTAKDEAMPATLRIEFQSYADRLNHMLVEYFDTAGSITVSEE